MSTGGFSRLVAAKGRAALRLLLWIEKNLWGDFTPNEGNCYFYRRGAEAQSKGGVGFQVPGASRTLTPDT
jgi:hypothetical protein